MIKTSGENRGEYGMIESGRERDAEGERDRKRVRGGMKDKD